MGTLYEWGLDTSNLIDDLDWGGYAGTGGVHLAVSEISLRPWPYCTVYRN